jgi:hypothetical protein
MAKSGLIAPADEPIQIRDHDEVDQTQFNS